MNERPDDPFPAVEEELWIERVLGISLKVLILFGLIFAAAIVLVIVLV